MLTDDAMREVLRSQRMLVGFLRNPKMRDVLVDALNGGSDGTDARLAPLGWWREDGPDPDRLSHHFAALTTLASEHGLLAYGPISAWPDNDSERPELVRTVIDRVFVGVSRGWLTESELTARIGVLFFDEAGLRRYAVDTGLLERETDGSRYWQAEPSS
ncbi:DUF2087 domain-containing protein [Demequina sp. B12]|uniref:DUF2087 domain-containing protein n=1 Tax=Demequina sp. B12 TaxID=2992757 RepID=UPI00237A6496|nr:DUF2087 domain-containing protein [Demequina sp. B12]MDE0572220.1 DUF2087 domain-containing protein [Demequina sp. B12]